MQIGSVDWNHPQWAGSFYPDSLPEDWWLTYYSNEFPCVLEPVAAASMPDAGQWLADTHPQFRFCLRLESAAEAQLSAALTLVSALDGRVAAVVCQQAGEGTDAGSGPARQLAAQGVVLALDGAAADHPWFDAGIASPVWRPEAELTGCRVGLLSALTRGDRRALRSCVEAFAGQAADCDPIWLFVDGRPPDVEALRDAAVIADLLGV